MASPMRSFSMTLGRRLVGSRIAAFGRSGMGMPVGTAPPPTKPLHESDELTWDDGSPNPEPCPDVILPNVSDLGALYMLLAGFGVYYGVAQLAKFNDKASRIPYTPREYPYDNLRVELGGEPE